MVECLILVGRPMQVKNDNGEIVAAEKNNSQELGHGGDELYDCLVLAAALLYSGLQGELKLDNERLRAQIKEALVPPAGERLGTSALLDRQVQADAQEKKALRLCTHVSECRVFVQHPFDAGRMRAATNRSTKSSLPRTATEQSLGPFT